MKKAELTAKVEAVASQNASLFVVGSSNAVPDYVLQVEVLEEPNEPDIYGKAIGSLMKVQYLTLKGATKTGNLMISHNMFSDELEDIAVGQKYNLKRNKKMYVTALELVQ